MAWLRHVALGRFAIVVLGGCVLAGSVLGGCGGAKTEQDRAKGAVTTFFAAVADDNGDAACVRLAPAGVQQVSAAAFLLRAPGSCQDAIKALNRQLDSGAKKSLKSARVVKVAITGSQAVVAQSDIQIKVSGQSSLFHNSTSGPIRLEKIAGDWKISSLG